MQKLRFSLQRGNKRVRQARPRGRLQTTGAIALDHSPEMVAAQLGLGERSSVKK
jgi:hypothetical protein